MSRAIWWIRRDLRLADNAALRAALEAADEVIPLFVLDPALLGSPWVGAKRVAFLLGGLRALDTSLRQRGGHLLVRRGQPQAELAAALSQWDATSIVAQADYSPYARQRDEAVAASLPVIWAGQPTALPTGTVLKEDGEPYTVYTPYSRRWRALWGHEQPLPAPERIPVPQEMEELEIPQEPALPAHVPFPPGEAEAARRLRDFAQGDDPPIYAYAQQRDRLDQPGTSQLSPYLRFGMCSARQAIAAAEAAQARAPDQAARRGAEVWLNELIWREFYADILYHFPRVRQASFRQDLGGIAWENDAGDLDAWREGRTGYPVVDAAMRCLAETGWMHNRARMITASFLVKHLLVDWRWGERWFMQQLVDGDPASNNGGWQWTAGTGTDAAPYFRIFNPFLQGRKYDPQGDYVRRWLPELHAVPNKRIHTPWEMSEEEQRAAGCVIGRDYPAPRVDHALARERALAAYGAARRSS